MLPTESADGPGEAGEGGPRPGDRLDGKYKLVARLGHGGFGDVWSAEELLPGGGVLRQVALKLLRADTDDVASWTEEAKLLASFRHPSLVTVYAAGILSGNGQRFVAMELLDGTNLADLQRSRGPIAWRRVLAWAKSTAAALDVIHRAEVVHLDLKPANLFLCKDGALKVLDFGISRRAAAAEPASRHVTELGPVSLRTASVVEGQLATMPVVAPAHNAFAETHRADAATMTARAIVGTPGFMAPEVLLQEAPTHAADAYALGVCIVELACGCLPHAVPDAPDSWNDFPALSAWITAIRGATIDGALKNFDAGPTKLPRGMAHLVRTLLHVDPRERGAEPGQLEALVDEAWERPFGVGDAPYPGLSPYPAEAQGLLFGRDDDIARLGRELEFGACVVLQGVSGVGKTSLARAGLWPYLAVRAIDGKDDVAYVEIVPGDDPDAALAAALHRVDPALGDASPEEVVAFGLMSRVALLLCFDPLDQLLAAPVDRRTRSTALVKLVAEKTGGAFPGVRLVGAIDDKSTAALLASELGPSLRASLRYIGGPAAVAVADLAASPARFAGAEVRGVEQVASDVQQELRAGDERLPLVSLALQGWWERRERGAGAAVEPPAPPQQPPPESEDSLADHAPLASEKIVIRTGPRSRSGVRGHASRSARRPTGATWILSLERWREMGGIGGALVRHADAAIAELDHADRALADELFARLAATDGTPREWIEAELVASLGCEAPDARRVIEHLERARLVVRRSGNLAISHELLLTSWKRPVAFRLKEMDRLLQLERLREAALAWERADGHRDFLMQGDLLKVLLARPEWIATGLSPRERAFVAQSRRRARRKRLSQGGLAAFGVLLVVAGLVAARAIQGANRAEEDVRRAAIELESITELGARAHRADDPYQKVALAAAAIGRGSADATLPLDLLHAAERAAPAEFLTLERVTSPSFPWNERWLVSLGANATLVVVDFQPREAGVIEDVALDADPTEAARLHVPRPLAIEVRPSAEPIVEVVPFAFDTSFVTRSTEGEVKVLRLGEDGTVALAAVAPMRCVGSARVASRVPVVVCPTAHGIVRWDLRANATQKLATHPFAGHVADVSPDGAHVLATGGRTALYWTPDEGREVKIRTEGTVLQARIAPQQDLIALALPRSLVVYDVARPDAPAVRIATQIVPASLRWDPGGLDVAVCDPTGAGAWLYLRQGPPGVADVRAKGDAVPSAPPCRNPLVPGAPSLLERGEVPEQVAGRDVGDHMREGGWRLSHDRTLSRDLVVFHASEGERGSPLRLRPRGRAERPGPLGYVARVERQGNAVAFQIRDEVAVYESTAVPTEPIATKTRHIGRAAPPHAGRSHADGERTLRRVALRPGRIAGACSDGRLLGWKHGEGDALRVFDVWSAADVAAIDGAVGFVLGVDAACTSLLVQRMDGSLVAHALGSPRSPPRVLARPDGYVYDVRQSRGGGAVAPGVWIALSSGALARVESDLSVRLYGYATPRAASIADGPVPGQLAFADAAGVSLVDASGKVDHVLEDFGDSWSDLASAPGSTTLLLASSTRLAVVDLARRELTTWIPFAGRGRLTPWEQDGSVLAWSFDRLGGPEGTLVPLGKPLATQVARSLSNLVVERGRLVVKR